MSDGDHYCLKRRSTRKIRCVTRENELLLLFAMQGIYTYIPETNPVHSEYSVAAIL
jgi:hypothetical protein